MNIERWNKDFGTMMIGLKVMMWPAGNWPLQNYNVFAAVRTTVALTAMFTMLTLLCAELSLNQHTIDKTVDVIMLIFCTILSITKTMFFRVHAANLVYNFESAVKDHAATIVGEERAIMKHHSFMGKMIVLCTLFFIYVDLLFFALQPILIKNMLVNGTSQYNVQRYPLPVGHTVALLKLPDNLYELTFATIFFILLITASGNIGSDCMFFAITIHLCGQVEVLKFRFTKFVTSDAKKSNTFEVLTTRHQYLLSLAKRLVGTISSVLIVQLSLSSILICILGFQLIVALKFRDIVIMTKAVAVLSTFLVQLFLYSYVGDYMKCQMEDLGYAAFCSGWYKFPKSMTKDITFLIMRAQRPMQIKAGKFFVVTVETYMDILKTSMSYLSVLRVMVNG